MKSTLRAVTQAIALAVASLECVAIAPSARAVPTGYVRQELPIGYSPAALAFDGQGKLYALGGAGFGDAVAAMTVFNPDGSVDREFEVTGVDPSSFFIGGMAYDPIDDRLLVTDNAAGGKIYAVGLAGEQSTVVEELPFVAGVAVRSTGQIVASTADGFGAGGVWEIDRTSGALRNLFAGLDFAAGLAFDGADLVVQDARSESPYAGRLQRYVTSVGGGGLEAGAPHLVLEGMTSSYGVVIDTEGDLFTTGLGGVYQTDGSPAVETSFFNNGSGFDQFATSVAFRPGSAPFEPFAGPGGGLLAVTADAGFVSVDSFITLFTPARPEDFDADGFVDGDDLAVWGAHFGAAAARDQGDADGDAAARGADFLRWQAAFGETTLWPALSAGAGRPVPEAPGGVLALVGAAGACAVRRRADTGRRSRR